MELKELFATPISPMQKFLTPTPEHLKKWPQLRYV